MNRLRSTLVGSTALVLALTAPCADAAFHFMNVVQFFPGSTAAPNAQYVMLQMYSGGQTQVGGHSVTIYNATGTSVGTATFVNSVANGNNQATILIATPESNAFFNMTSDLTVPLTLPLAGGKICFDVAPPIDCVAWGTWIGPSSGVGTPYALSSGLHRNEAVVRDLKGNALLEAGDDTDDSAADFDPAIPTPRNNAGSVGTLPPSTCGNSVLESLEACDDGNTQNGDGCNSTCTVGNDVFVDGFED